MGSQRIRLRGMGPHLEGLTWESEGLLRIGRYENLEVALNDTSVSRQHAEVALTELGWVVRDLGSTNGSYVNGLRVGRADTKLQEGDILRCGNICTIVEILQEQSPVNGKEEYFLNRERNLFVQTLTLLAQMVELRDDYTGSHTQRVTDYALLLAEELDLPDGERYQLRIGTPLHDIGKIGIRDAILWKSGPLTPEESEYMKSHTTKGVAILETIPSLTALIPIVRSHHERWDGNGYPDGLVGAQIPFLARVVCVADSFDAMTTERPYRPAVSVDKALVEIERQAGSQFDRQCAAGFLRLRPRLQTLFDRRALLVNTSDQRQLLELTAEIKARSASRSRTLAVPRSQISQLLAAGGQGGRDRPLPQS